MQSLPETPELTPPTDLSGHLWVQELSTGGRLRFQVTAAGGLAFATPDETDTTVTALSAPYRRAAWRLREALDRDAVRSAVDDPETITFVGRATWNEGVDYPWRDVPAFLGSDVWSDRTDRFLPPDAATAAFERLGVPTLPAVAKEQPVSRTDLSQYTDPDGFPSSAWRDGRAAGVLLRDKTGTRAQAWRPVTTATGPDRDDPSVADVVTRHATEERIAETVARLDATEYAPSVEAVRDRVVADITRERYPELYRDGDPVVSMRALDSAIAESVQRYLADRP
ncbi:hypothetical protein [Halobellus sp. EA9]|uniref:hypothetical protein n=1 Tax=Halobellus sp. EA9 TaxID=3421647 RepID=UPI003EB9186E